MAEVSVPEVTKITAESSTGGTQALKTSGVEGDWLKITAEHGHLLNEILKELRINNQYLRIIIGEDNTITDSDTGE